MKRLALAWLSLLLIIALCPTTQLAQTHSPTPRAEGELKGIVLDPNDARVAGAKITIENKRDRFELWSTDEGAFQLKLPVGEYQIKIESNGFKPYIKKRVRIEADKTETMSVTVTPSSPQDLIKIDKV
jgi:hypothetical protein